MCTILVGIVFVIFSSIRFEIETNDGNSAAQALINDAAPWVSSTNDKSPDATIVASSRSDVGTRVTVQLENAEHPLFSLTYPELEFILRTRTAIGDTGYLWDTPLNADVTLTHVTKDGSQTSKEFECRYMLPTEGLKRADVLELTEFKEWLTADRSDAEKRRKLKDKILYHSEWTTKANRTLRWWSCFIPTRSWWDQLNTHHKLQSSEPGDDDRGGLGFGSGLATSTRGMPTGIVLDIKPKGSAGYVPNFFILVEDPELSFDIGRKAIPGRQQGMLREIAQTDFREYINRAQKYISGEPEGMNVGWDRSREFAEVESLLSLSSDKTRFARRPDAQEATVAAIFFEQIGRGEFPKIRPLLSGYKKKYDLYATYDGGKYGHRI